MTNTTVACNVGMAAGLEVSASMTGAPTPLATGKVGVSWPTVFKEGCVPDPDTLTIRTDANFDDALKVFDIDPNNPVALLGTILNAVDALAGGIEALSGGVLDNDLPLVGMKPRDLLGGLSNVQAKLDFLRSHPAESLQQLETMLEKELGLEAEQLTLELGDAPGTPAERQGPADQAGLRLRRNDQQADGPAPG